MIGEAFNNFVNSHLSDEDRKRIRELFNESLRQSCDELDRSVERGEIDAESASLYKFKLKECSVKVVQDPEVDFTDAESVASRLNFGDMRERFSNAYDAVRKAFTEFFATGIERVKGGLDWKPSVVERESLEEMAARERYADELLELAGDAGIKVVEPEVVEPDEIEDETPVKDETTVEEAAEIIEEDAPQEATPMSLLDALGAASQRQVKDVNVVEVVHVSDEVDADNASEKVAQESASDEPVVEASVASDVSEPVVETSTEIISGPRRENVSEPADEMYDVSEPDAESEAGDSEKSFVDGIWDYVKGFRDTIADYVDPNSDGNRSPDQDRRHKVVQMLGNAVRNHPVGAAVTLVGGAATIAATGPIIGAAMGVGSVTGLSSVGAGLAAGAAKLGIGAASGAVLGRTVGRWIEDNTTVGAVFNNIGSYMFDNMGKSFAYLTADKGSASDTRSRRLGTLATAGAAFAVGGVPGAVIGLGLSPAIGNMAKKAPVIGQAMNYVDSEDFERRVDALVDKAKSHVEAMTSTVSEKVAEFEADMASDKAGSSEASVEDATSEPKESVFEKIGSKFSSLVDSWKESHASAGTEPSVDDRLYDTSDEDGHDTVETSAEVEM